MRKLIGILLLALMVPLAQAKLVTKVVHYQEGDTKFNGYLAYDTKFKGKRPGILVVHEWWGQNAYARKRAKMLAKLGYVAFALDMYGNGKTATHPQDAGKFAKMVSSNMPLAKARFLAALDQLKANPLTDPDKIAAIGYCFGGGIVLQMARQGVDLKGVVSFHCSLRSRAPNPLCKTATFPSNTTKNRASIWGVSEISGTKTTAPRPLLSVSSTARM